MAERGLGTTAPNPSVGAVIVDETIGEVIARGWTQPGGRPHAETEALQRAGSRARGATMYVTLEPCSHYGKTPPCSDAIIKAGISRVVVAILDPDPRVAGRGLDNLRKAGIAVRKGVCAAEADRIARGHILRVTERRPLVQVKMALDNSGAVPRGVGGAPVWVTSPLARAHSHLLRARADAILVGERTVADDNPDLTCRLPGMIGRSPIRVVLCGSRLPEAASKLVRSADQHPVLIVCDPAAGPAAKADLERAGCRILPVTSIGGRPWLPAVAEALVAEGITRLLVEGGPTVWRAFLAIGLVDEVALYRAAGGEEPPSRQSAQALQDLVRFGAVNAFIVAGAQQVGPDHLFMLSRARGG
jgi:diaminohydroxyphosphoribosylaminopyrimidine deaminase/5-amino-6-(5-phosphoribosylamino)uracil reductase